jgi:hypothetical protein
VIKGIVGDERHLSDSESRALNALDGKIVSAAERERPHGPETLAKLAKRIGLSLKELREMAALGAFDVGARRQAVSRGQCGRDRRGVGGHRAAGFSDALGFGPADLAIYVEMVEWLAREELGRFASRVAAKVDPETARRMAQDGIERINVLLARLRETILLRAIAAGNLPAGEANEAG